MHHYGAQGLSWVKLYLDVRQLGDEFPPGTMPDTGNQQHVTQRTQCIQVTVRNVGTWPIAGPHFVEVSAKVQSVVPGCQRLLRSR